MPLVVSSLMGDASDVFDWIFSLNPGNTQDLTTLLQMLREHYCGSLTFREQRNTIENLCQKPQEAAIDFLIRVGTSVSNLGKDWKDELTDEELQYEVSLNGVHEEIRHVLDSKIAKNGGKLTPQQMYEAVKRYETYVTRNKRLEGKGASSSTSQPKAGAVALQPGDVVMVRTDGFVGKRKVKDRWEDGGFIVESQLEDWPVYKVKCSTSDDRQKPKYWILHRNRLLLVTDEDASSIPGQAQTKVTPIVSNATPEAFPEGTGLLEKLLPSLVTRQGGDMTSWVWLNGEFRTKPWTQTVPEATQSPPDLIGDEVSEPESEFSDSVPEGT